MNKKILGIILLFLLVVITSFVWYTFSSYTSVTIAGDSMLPTLKDNTKILVDKKYYDNNPVERGDIIVYNMTENKIQIKRVVGLPNEKLQIKDGTIYIDDKPIDKSFIFNEILADGSLRNKGIFLGEDEYFIVGDNAKFSMDSRYFGPIKKDLIGGKVIKVK